MTKYESYEHKKVPPEKSSQNTITGSPIVWLLFGVGIGVGAALLLIPSTGRDLRNALARGYRRAIDGISRSTHQLRRRRSNLISFRRSS
jgi:gas vesicle protein